MERQAKLPARRTPRMAGCLCAALFPSLVFAHGEKGIRDVAVFDVSAAPTVPDPVMRAFGNGIRAFPARAAAGRNECITLKATAMWMSGGGKMLPLPRDFDGSRFDYVLWGELTGAEGAYQYSIRLATAASRTAVVTAAGSFQTAAEAEAAGLKATAEIVNSQGHVSEAVRLFERARRSGKTVYAMGPSLSVTGPSEMNAGASADLTLELKDCDGTVLASRKLDSKASDGKVSPAEAVTDDGGAGKLTYSAPARKSVATVTVWFAHSRPSERVAEMALQQVGIRVVRPSTYEPPVWKALVAFRNRVDGRIASNPATPQFFNVSSQVWELCHVAADFSIDRFRKAMKGEVGFYEWKYDMMTKRAGSPFVSQVGQETGDKLGYTDDDGSWVQGWEFRMKRRLQPAPGVPELNVTDPDDLLNDITALIAARRAEFDLDKGKPDEIFLEGKGKFPANSTTTNYMGGEVQKGDVRRVADESHTFQDYKYQQRANHGFVNLLAQSVTLKEIGVRSRWMMYDLVFLPKFDFVRGDFAIEINGEDFTDKFKLRKFWRDWQTDATADDAMRSRTRPYTQVADWTTGEDPMPNPSVQAQQYMRDKAQDPNLVWPNVRHLREYLVQVEDFPEMGFFYYVYTWETFPAQSYWVRKFEPVRITADDWKQIKTGAAPHRSEDNSGIPGETYR